jgi:hypothetical protein
VLGARVRIILTSRADSLMAATLTPG